MAFYNLPYCALLKLVAKATGGLGKIFKMFYFFFSKKLEKLFSLKRKLALGSLVNLPLRQRAFVTLKRKVQARLRGREPGRGSGPQGKGNR